MKKNRSFCPHFKNKDMGRLKEGGRIVEQNISKTLNTSWEDEFIKMINKEWLKICLRSYDADKLLHLSLVNILNRIRTKGRNKNNG